jgi:hypothetical protein
MSERFGFKIAPALEDVAGLRPGDAAGWCEVRLGLRGPDTRGRPVVNIYRIYIDMIELDRPLSGGRPNVAFLAPQALGGNG